MLKVSSEMLFLWRISSCSPFNLMTFSVADGSPLANRSRTFSNILSKSVILHYYFLSKSNRNKQMTASYARMGISYQFIDSSAAHKRLHRHLTSSCDSDKELLFVLSAWECGMGKSRGKVVLPKTLMRLLLIFLQENHVYHWFRRFFADFLYPKQIPLIQSLWADCM